MISPQAFETSATVQQFPTCGVVPLDTMPLETTLLLFCDLDLLLIAFPFPSDCLSV